MQAVIDRIEEDKAVLLVGEEEKSDFSVDLFAGRCW